MILTLIILAIIIAVVVAVLVLWHQQQMQKMTTQTVSSLIVQATTKFRLHRF